MTFSSDWEPFLANHEDSSDFLHEPGILTSSSDTTGNANEIPPTPNEFPVTTPDDACAGSISDERKCSVKACRALLGPDEPMKMCQICRSKHRDYAKTKRARRKHEKTTTNNTINGVTASSTDMVIDPQLLGEDISLRTGSTHPVIHPRASRHPPSPLSEEEERILIEKHQREQERAVAMVNDGPRRYCTIKGCKCLIPDDYLYKMCLKCRHKYRGYGTTKRAKWKEDRITTNVGLGQLRAEEDAKREAEGKQSLAECPGEWQGWEKNVLQKDIEASHSSAQPNPSSIAAAASAVSSAEATTSSHSNNPLTARVCTVSHCRAVLPLDHPYRRCDEHRLQNQKHGVLKRIRDKEMKAQALQVGLPAISSDDLVGENAPPIDPNAPILPQPSEPPFIRGYRRASTTCMNINCQNILSNLEPWKTCEVCREDNREKRKRREDPEYQRQRFLLLADKEKKRAEDVAEARSCREKKAADLAMAASEDQLEEEGAGKDTEMVPDAPAEVPRQPVELDPGQGVDYTAPPATDTLVEEGTIGRVSAHTIPDGPYSLVPENASVSSTTLSQAEPNITTTRSPSSLPVSAKELPNASLDGSHPPHSRSPSPVHMKNLCSEHESPSSWRPDTQLRRIKPAPAVVGPSQTFMVVFRCLTTASHANPPPRPSPSPPPPPSNPNKPLQIIMHPNQPPATVITEPSFDTQESVSAPVSRSKRIKFSTPLTSQSMSETEGRVRRRPTKVDNWITTSSRDYVNEEPPAPFPGFVQPLSSPPPQNHYPPSAQSVPHQPNHHPYRYYTTPTQSPITPYTHVYQPWSQSSSVPPNPSYYTPPRYYASYPPPPPALSPPVLRPTGYASQQASLPPGHVPYQIPGSPHWNQGVAGAGGQEESRHAHVVPFSMPVSGHYENEPVQSSQQIWAGSPTSDTARTRIQKCTFKGCHRSSRGALCDKCKIKLKRRIELTKKRHRVVPKPGLH